MAKLSKSASDSIRHTPGRFTGFAALPVISCGSNGEKEEEEEEDRPKRLVSKTLPTVSEDGYCPCERLREKVGF